MKTPVITYENLITGLRKLELPPNPILLTHLSLKSLGYVEGGALTVIRALLHICGNEGTLVMPTLTFGIVNEHAPVFDVKHTPTNTGHIPEVFRKLPDSKRSRHIFSSVAAIGKQAESIVSWHEDTPCGNGTPYHKIVEMGGYSLFIGAGFGSNSLFHVAEEFVHPPYLTYKTIENATVVDQDGRITNGSYRRYNCSQTGVVRHLAQMEAVYRDAGIVTETRLGEASVKLVGASDNFKISCELLKRDPDFILNKGETIK
ncbi:AAC(3) family N-acetyltransferase [Paenibacillus koleovorans]|uniref:AAC(3) family N-acetyltransferase n=1 Tax=Paenibacillus koleovorans TaxID=121608 RepID=UPI000FD6D5B1|nr:AAC(3) family N-acetyltransferase [Paenibacillus koleovorans]